jgi:hypothetical protein
MRRLFGGLGLVAALVLAACGGSDMGAPSTHDASGARGSLVYSPPLRITGMDAAEFTARLQGSAAGQGLLKVTGAPRCGVLFHYIEYGTVGGAAEPTRASGALMLPTGSDPACAGARPIVLYAHGTSPEKSPTTSPTSPISLALARARGC